MTGLITLLTDFGHQDAYVGVMKGVIAAIAPEARVIDLTHNIPPQDRWAARFNLLNACPHFPGHTIHLAVVDPGVGSQRRGVAIATDHGLLVGPDNGIFSGVLSQTRVQQAIALTHSPYWRTPTPSTTFHGRDIFAPVAAHLATGLPVTALGQAIAAASLITLDLPPLTSRDRTITGTVQYCDHFGNLITTIPGDRVGDRAWEIQIKGHLLSGVQTYSDRPPGTLLALIGSHGWIEIAINQGNAAAMLNPCPMGTTVTLTWAADMDR